MEPKISEGEDQEEVKAELKGLINDGWELDEEQRGVKKTYHFKTYTKVLVGYPTDCNNHVDTCRICTKASE
jgi:4a-hydroxytetrahydrobiopterin dehydratase